MNMKQLKYVLVLSKEGNFSKAADALNISQPSLSQYIKNIEKELGTELFQRTGSEVRITDAGRIYIEVGRKILDLEHRLQNQLVDISTYKTGSICIGVSPHRSLCLMPEAISEFHKKYPGIRVIADERISKELIDCAEHGEFDLCITTLPVNESVFTCEHIMREEIIVAVPYASEMFREFSDVAENISERKYPAIDVSYIDGIEFIALSESQLMRKRLDNICADYGINVNIIVECKNIESQLAMVRASIGAALVPSTIDNYNPEESKIAYFSIKQELPFRDIVVMYKKDQFLSETVNAFKDILKDIGKR